ncbi:MAG: hypothetical protein IID41_13320 [Planctomycetes bacterium]|nr:hypothetical protein [Planctomycetota bacterium]
MDKQESAAHVRNWVRDELLPILEEVIEGNEAGLSRVHVFITGMLSYEEDPLLWRRLIASWFSTNPDAGTALRQTMEQQNAAIREGYAAEKRRVQEAQDG